MSTSTECCRNDFTLCVCSDLGNRRMALTAMEEPSNYMQTLTQYLSNIMTSTLLGLPREIKELIYFDALSHAAERILVSIPRWPLPPPQRGKTHLCFSLLTDSHSTNTQSSLSSGPPTPPRDQNHQPQRRRRHRQGRPIPRRIRQRP